MVNIVTDVIDVAVVNIATKFSSQYKIATKFLASLKLQEISFA